MCIGPIIDPAVISGFWTKCAWTPRAVGKARAANASTRTVVAIRSRRDIAPSFSRHHSIELAAFGGYLDQVVRLATLSTLRCQSQSTSPCQEVLTLRLA